MGLLKYDTRERKWAWDDFRISDMDITGNVLYILACKMFELPSNIKNALKVASCFGIKIQESVVSYLDQNSTSMYANIRDALEQAVVKGQMVKVETEGFKFVHDKVREAAYSLIPESERSQVSIRMSC